MPPAQDSHKIKALQAHGGVLANRRWRHPLYNRYRGGNSWRGGGRTRSMLARGGHISMRWRLVMRRVQLVWMMGIRGSIVGWAARLEALQNSWLGWGRLLGLTRTWPQKGPGDYLRLYSLSGAPIVCPCLHEGPQKTSDTGRSREWSIWLHKFGSWACVLPCARKGQLAMSPQKRFCWSLPHSLWSYGVDNEMPMVRLPF